jgi:hypothetical protein
MIEKEKVEVITELSNFVHTKKKKWNKSLV